MNRVAVFAGAALAGVAAERLLLERLGVDDRGALPTIADVAEPPGITHHTWPTHDGGTLHAVEAGAPTAPVLVLLHGITLQARVWDRQLADLAPSFRVVACDLRGHGRSTAGRDGMGLDAAARDLTTLFDRLDLDRAIVVGHSMGGMVLSRWCAAYPSVLARRVRGLVFLSTSSGIPLPPRANRIASRLGAQAVAWGERREWRIPTLRFPPNDLSFLLCRAGFGRGAAAADVSLTRSMIAAVPAEASMASGFGLLGHDARAALRATRTPALVVVGDRDLLTPVRLARHIAEHLGDAQLEVIAGGGHMLMLERPGELAGLLRRFAATVGRPG